jgi:hypothetical protein
MKKRAQITDQQSTLTQIQLSQGGYYLLYDSIFHIFFINLIKRVMIASSEALIYRVFIIVQNT